MIVQACKLLSSFLGKHDDMQAPVFRRQRFRNQAFLEKGINDPAEISFIDGDIRSNLLGRTIFYMRDLVKDPPLRQREWAVKEVLVKQANNICVEPVETSDPIDQFLIRFHKMA